MSGVDFANLRRSHVLAAVKYALSHGVPAERKARSAWVRVGGRSLPAKYLVGLAYEIATGIRLKPNQFTGGESASNVLKRLGFRVSGPSQHVPTHNSSVRVVTACVAGRPASGAAENKSRAQLLSRVAEEVARRNWKPKILIMPGGYFHLSSHVGDLDLSHRVSRVAWQSFAKSCTAAARELNCLVVAGLDSVRKRRAGFRYPDAPDQLSVAWNGSSIIGMGRKVFPTSDELDDLVIYEEDLRARSRLAPVDRRSKALLFSCYDMFGCDESAHHRGKRSQNIRWLSTKSHGLLDRRTDRNEVDAILASALTEWEGLVAAASVGCAAIHYFSRSGPGSGKAYWHRHGIRKASRILGSRLAFGAAHMDAPLPQPNVATFAAKEGKTLYPADAFEIGDGAALVRLFTP